MSNPNLPSRSSLLAWSTAGVSLVLFFLAVALPAADFIAEDGSAQTWSGFPFLAYGWFGPLMSGRLWGWFANVFLAVAWFCLGLRWRLAATGLGAVALVVALSSFGLFGVEVWQNEGGVNNLLLESFRLGFYLWLLAIALVPIGGLVAWIQRPPQASATANPAA